MSFDLFTAIAQQRSVSRQLPLPLEEVQRPGRRVRTPQQAWGWKGNRPVAVEPKRPRGPRRRDRLTIVSSGLGRDSNTVVCLLLAGQLIVEGKRVQPEDVDAVVFSDTGMEWPFTYALERKVRAMLAAKGVPFFVLRKPSPEQWRPWTKFMRDRYDKAISVIAAAERAGNRRKANRLRSRLEHPAFGDLWWEEQVGYPSRVAEASVPWMDGPWTDILEKARRGGYHHREPLLPNTTVRARVPMRRGGECTTHHKIIPVQRFAEDLAIARWGPTADNKTWEAEVKAGRRLPHRMVIGIAADEQSRAKPSHEPGFAKVFPLVEMGIGKHAMTQDRALLRRRKSTKAKTGLEVFTEQQILDACGLGHTRKSGCWTCMWQPISWFWALSEAHPKLYAEVLDMEARALERNPGFTLRGSKPLETQVRAWRKANPRATIDAVLDKDYQRCGLA